MMLAIVWAEVLAAACQEPPATGRDKFSLVQAKATAQKPDAEGWQAVTVTLQIEKGYYLFANPPGDDTFKDCETTVSLSAKKPLRVVKVKYPPGKLEAITFNLVEGGVVRLEYRIYENQVTIKASVRREKGDVSPLEVRVTLKPGHPLKSFSPETIKLSVP
jgi:hypothetical protein